MSTKNALITKIWKKLKKLSQIDVLSSPKCSPIYYAFHFKEVLILSKINSFACESGVKKKFVVRWTSFGVFAGHFCFSFFGRKTKQCFPFFFLSFVMGEGRIKMNVFLVLKIKKNKIKNGVTTYLSLFWHGQVFSEQQ